MLVMTPSRGSPARPAMPHHRPAKIATPPFVVPLIKEIPPPFR
jgi:hypothetical protein